MNKIINWTFGSFFRTIGRIIAFIVLGALFTYVLQKLNINIWQVLDVHAASGDWVYDGNYSPALSVNFYNWSSSTEASGISSSSSDIELIPDTYNNDGTYDYKVQTIFYRTGSSVGSNGYTLSYQMTELFYHYYLYSISLYACTGGNLTLSAYNNSSFKIANTGWNAVNATMQYSYMAVVEVGVPYMRNDSTFTFNHCYQIVGLVSPNTTGLWASIRLKGSGSGILAAFGGNFENLGKFGVATTSEVQSIVSNSGLATATSVSEVNTSVNQVKEELNGVNSSIEDQTQQQQENHEETMNTITDDTINENGVSDFTDGLNKEYSSLTPFSDFLNLPLTWIQSLLASGQSCTTIHLPLPYLDNKYLDLPCMTEFWQKMGAVGTLVQLVWIAIVGVRIFNGLFLLTCETIDPNPDKDMTKLRTWEL